MVTQTEQQTINELQANWVWPPNWIDSSINSAGRIVRFKRELSLRSIPRCVPVHCSADTRYKLFVNGARVAVGPARSSPLIWYYDSIDIAPHLREGSNLIEFVVLRYYIASRHAMPFHRTAFPGLTVVGVIEDLDERVILNSAQPGWTAQVDESVSYPIGRIDDVFLHINERIAGSSVDSPLLTPECYNIKTLNGELSPWRLRPRQIPMPVSSPLTLDAVRYCNSSIAQDNWLSFLRGNSSVILPATSQHVLEIQAGCHSTAFLQWAFASSQASHIKLKIRYSEGYELEPRAYPFFRTKADRLDASNGRIIGPYDEVHLDVLPKSSTLYEPFWFRTFRVIRLEIVVGPVPVELLSFTATQVNYPLSVKASWREPANPISKQIWDVSIRTMRNCMYDGYSDCPFYEQLQYSGDSRVVGILHYLLSGDDRLMRQAITGFAASTTPEGLPQSRFPSHVPQIVAGFTLLSVLQVCDHHLYFGDAKFARSFLPYIDGILNFFDSHVDELGLVSGLPDDVWQYVDWATTWGATESHPDKGVPTSGRESNRHTYFSMLYAYVLQQAASLVRQVGRPGYAEEYQSRAAAVVTAIQQHCFDGSYFTDSTANIADDSAYSQHCQVFAVLCRAASTEVAVRILQGSFASTSTNFTKCSYMMQFYALRAFLLAGDEEYNDYWARVWSPWHKMLANNMSTWEEDDVRQRSDCHAWGSVPIFEYCTELAGVQPLSPGCSRILFKPRLLLASELEAKVALGKDNMATVSWKRAADNSVRVSLQLTQAVEILSLLPSGAVVNHGRIDSLALDYAG